MFGLSFPKLLLLVLAVAIVWYGYKAVRRRDERRMAETSRPPAGPAAETMVKCPVCGTYNPAGVVCTHRS
jgi:hypothetical protein